MDEILSIKANKDNIKISINGENLDILIGIKETLKQMEKQSGITINHSMAIIKGWIKEDAKKEFEDARRNRKNIK